MSKDMLEGLQAFSLLLGLIAAGLLAIALVLLCIKADSVLAASVLASSTLCALRLRYAGRHFEASGLTLLGVFAALLVLALLKGPSGLLL